MSATDEERIQRAIQALKSRRFDARFAQDREAARAMILELVPQGASVGLGNSTTLFQIGVIEALEARGQRVINPFPFGKPPSEPFDVLARRCLSSDVFLAGVSAITEDGRLVNTDATGNRVTGMIFGPKKTILLASQNKIVKDLDAALDRIKSVVAPAHARNRGFDTPCAITGKCSDCRAKQRICNATVILEGKPWMSDISIVLIGEDLGLGWEPDWPQERIDRIRQNYVAGSWRPVKK